MSQFPFFSDTSESSPVSLEPRFYPHPSCWVGSVVLTEAHRLADVIRWTILTPNVQSKKKQTKNNNLFLKTTTYTQTRFAPKSNSSQVMRVRLAKITEVECRKAVHGKRQTGIRGRLVRLTWSQTLTHLEDLPADQPVQVGEVCKVVGLRWCWTNLPPQRWVECGGMDKGRRPERTHCRAVASDRHLQRNTTASLKFSSTELQLLIFILIGYSLFSLIRLINCLIWGEEKNCNNVRTKDISIFLRI